ncbi:MAG: T9SS type A sorting domain-containing protein [Bacteroidales bacterium]
MLRKLLLAFGISLFWITISWAVTVQVGSGTSTTSALPIYSCYGYTYSQQIYTQPQINQAGEITAIRFYYSSGSYSSSDDAWTIYMGHTSKSSFASTTDWEPVASLTEVFSGAVTFPATGNWMEITLTTPFNYNNTDNLLIAVDENESGFNCSIYWGSFTSGSNTGIYYRSDGTNPDPASPPTAYATTGTLAQVQLEFTVAGAPGVPSNPSPADNATNVASSGELTWDFGADTDTYDLWFGPAGSMTQVVTGAAAGATGSYAYSVSGGLEYEWQVVANNSAKASVNGPVWSFTTAIVPGTCGVWEVSLIDSYGDGWNGGSLDIYVNGVVVLSGLTIADGNGPETHQFATDIDDIISADYTAGSYSAENQYIIYDESSTEVANEGASGSPGDVGDYTIPTGLTSCPSCPDPSDQSVGSLTGTTADLGWTENGSATSWEIELGVAGFTPSGTPTVTGATNPYTYGSGAEGPLSSGTAYEWYVRADCGGDYSDWVGPHSFSTPCASTSVPYFENFDNETAPAFPVCMAVENTNGDSYKWETATGTYVSAPNAARIGWNSSLAMDDWFFTQGLDLTSGVSYEVSFVYRAGSSFYPENLAVDWGTASNSGAMSGTPLYTHEGIDGGWYLANITFTPASTGVFYFGFHGYSDADQLYLYVDNISVIPAIEGSDLWTGTTDSDWHTAGNWSGGVPTTGTDVTIPAGATNYPTIGGLAQCNSIFVESGASLLDNGNLITGSATVERDYSGNVWHLIAAPVDGPLAGIFTGLYLQSHDEPSNAYVEIIDVNTPINAGQGYAVWNPNGVGPHTASYSGSLNYSVTRSLTRSAAGTDNGWNLVGNPFPSSIDWGSAGISKTNVGGSTYRLDAGGSGSWAVWNGTVGTNGATQYIASGQGFFVSVNDDGSTTGSLTFGNAARVHDNTTFFKAEPADIVKLRVSGNGFTDETAVYFRSEASIGFDNQMDAYQIPSLEESAPYIYSCGNGGMSINVLPEVQTVPLNVNIGTQEGNFTIDLVKNGEFENLYLEDVATGIVTDLNAASYDFEFIPGLESRFNLHFSPLSVIDNRNELYHIYSFNKDVYVAVPENANGTITIYDLMGREVVSTSISNTVNRITLEKSAYYVVVVLSNETVVTEKVFIK